MSEPERGQEREEKQTKSQREAATNGERRHRSHVHQRELQVQRDQLASYSKRPDKGGLGQIDNPAMLVGGGALALYGLKHWRSIMGLMVAGIGGGLIYQGLKQNDLLNGNLKELMLNTGASKATQMRSTITINRPVEEVYSQWRDLSNLGRCMNHIESVRRIDDTHWHWRARLPKTDQHIEWDAETIDERENELLVWRSVRHSEIQNEGMVEFRPGPHGDSTEIHAHIVYYPPAGKVGQLVGRFLKGLSEQVVKEDLRRFKQFMEVGEVPTIEGQPSGREPFQPGQQRPSFR